MSGFRGLPAILPYSRQSGTQTPSAAGGFRGLPGIAGLAWKSFAAGAVGPPPPPPIPVEPRQIEQQVGWGVQARRKRRRPDDLIDLIVAGVFD